MKKSIQFLLFLLLLNDLCSSAQSKHDVSPKKTEQGMAIYNNMAFLFYDTGICKVFDLKKKQYVREFSLGSKSVNNHANCACFGKNKFLNSEFPLLYISECRPPQRCFVECLTDTGAVLVQTIVLKRKGVNAKSFDWIVDNKREVLYTIGRRKSDVNPGSSLHRINKYRIPELREGKNVILTDKDVLDSFDIEFPNMLQGGTIKGNYLYLPAGLHENASNKKEKERTLIVVNLKTHKIERKIDLRGVTKKEPEDCDFYKGKLILYCGQSGGLCKIPNK